MAAVTGFNGGNVICRLAGRAETVVAGGTGTKHFGVIDHDCRLPEVGLVAGLTDLGGGDVSGVLARSIDAIVATGAVAIDAAVIEVDANPGHGVVALGTIIRALRMIDWFPVGKKVVVAALTAAEHRVVIDERHRRPARRDVAAFALGGGSDVVIGFGGGRDET